MDFINQIVNFLSRHSKLKLISQEQRWPDPENPGEFLVDVYNPVVQIQEDYEKYMTHQPYEDCQSLEIDKVLSWEVGSLLYWNRTRIHSSDNFFKSNVISKTAIVLCAADDSVT